MVLAAYYFFADGALMVSIRRLSPLSNAPKSCSTSLTTDPPVFATLLSVVGKSVAALLLLPGRIHFLVYRAEIC